MVTVIVGHRGTGKTKFLERLQCYFTKLNRHSQNIFFDLDAEIVNRHSSPIDDIFSKVGEGEFRRIEAEVFNDIYQEYRRAKQDVYIALGAGFSAELPQDIEVWWLRRESDTQGRVFLNRPRLEPDLGPLEEYQKRFAERDERFRKIAHRQITIGEGFDKPNEFESKLIGFLPTDLDVSIAVTPWVLENAKRADLFFARQLQAGVCYFEFRDDLLNEEQICAFAQKIPLEKVLISFRSKQTSNSLVDFAGPYATDWAIELGSSPFLHNKIVSLHERQKDETVDEAAARLLSFKADHYKLAIPIHDLTELWIGHQFLLSDAQKHSFLPMSGDGRWRWYRLTQKQKINFTREGDGLADQPCVFDFLRYPKNTNGFAAILGNPVHHSRTPAEQSDFFSRYSMGVVAIPLEEVEFQALNLSILERIGLRAAAVTAPLKTAAVRICNHLDKKASDIGAVNTLVKTSTGWSGTNTDLIGVARTFHALKLTNETVVWGGGGTRLVLRALLPEARFFSARRGEQIWVEVQSSSDVNPQTLIWAVGRNRMGTSQWPPEKWRPQFVFDLNYSEDSPGMEYASRVGARYFSGLQMFSVQAEAQREYWGEML